MREAKVLSVIRTDGGTQARAGLDEAKVTEYTERMEAGDNFPAMVAFYDGTDYWLADGFHRHAAALRAGKNTYLVDVKQGTRRDAVLHACGANADHGLPRTDGDKRRAVETLLRDEEWGKWSDREIARRCKVSHPFVGKIRADLNLTGNVTSEERTYITRHGTPATMDTSKIGNGAAAYEAIHSLQDAVLAYYSPYSRHDAITLLETLRSDHKNPAWSGLSLHLGRSGKVFRVNDLRQAVSNALDTLWQQAIWQSEQEIEGMPEIENPVYEVPGEKLQEIHKLYSADCIATGQKVRGLFEYDGSLWLCVGSGDGCDACMVIPRSEFGGTIMQKYSHIARRRRDRTNSNFYCGLLISHQGQEYVVAWARATFRKAEVQPILSQSSEPARETLVPHPFLGSIESPVNQEPDLVDLVTEFALGYKDWMNRDWAQIENPSHTNGTFWQRIKKWLELRDVAYKNDAELKIAIKRVFAKLKNEPEPNLKYWEQFVEGEDEEQPTADFAGDYAPETEPAPAPKPRIPGYVMGHFNTANEALKRILTTIPKGEKADIEDCMVMLSSLELFERRIGRKYELV